MSQKIQVLQHLRAGYTITQLEALKEYGVMRLADVVFKLRKEGHDIRKTWVQGFDSKYKYARYYYYSKQKDVVVCR